MEIIGYSHHALQDYALMRSFPNTIICSPNRIKLIGVMDYIFKNPQPTYLRLDKSLNLNCGLKIKSIKLRELDTF